MTISLEQGWICDGLRLWTLTSFAKLPGMVLLATVLIAIAGGTAGLAAAQSAAVKSPESAKGVGSRAGETKVGSADSRIALLGRYAGQVSRNLANTEEAPLMPSGGEVRFGYPGGGFALRYAGEAPSLDLQSDNTTTAVTMTVDGGEPVTAVLQAGRHRVATPRPAAIAPDGPHTLLVIKRTETWQGLLHFFGVSLPAGTTLLDRPGLPTRRLMFLGDSVTCGAGVGRDDSCRAQPQSLTNDAWNSYGMILGRRLDARAELVCYGGRGVLRDYRGLGIADDVLNAPEFVSLAIPTDDPKQRAPWDETLSAPDAIVVSLGTNDFALQSTKPLDRSRFVETTAKLLRHLLATYPRARIVLTNGAIVANPLLLQYLTEAATRVHSDHVIVVEGTHYKGNTCDAHPTASQHQRIADGLEPVLRKQLRW